MFENIPSIEGERLEANYRNPGYHDLKAFNEAKSVNLILQVFNRLQRLRNLKGKHQLNE
ncbi:hypothetical protein [Shewanella baltica]|uniref:hypothetical protein n=1 Tax=Shewanella baltica TaxID=62322 RepID=UPI00031B3783|nr:hypothetical protein [Shewanella baltica]